MVSATNVVSVTVLLIFAVCFVDPYTPYDSTLLNHSPLPPIGGGGGWQQPSLITTRRGGLTCPYSITFC
ncbi:hypothetical protein ALC53_04044 [Atta colombica]|uniref:Uncharacterized protein n=1 Tax=Atta colombica TaxID=520822 RepID=A0A195BLK5_9HYME|nr:hypothetical protein ALC53_04044 [Atta colombica]